MLASIRRENITIPDPSLPRRSVIWTATRIFQAVIDQPEKRPRSAVSVSWTIICPIFENAHRLSRAQDSGVAGFKAQSTKERITSAMDVVLGAFKTA